MSCSSLPKIDPHSTNLVTGPATSSFLSQPSSSRQSDDTHQPDVEQDEDFGPEDTEHFEMTEQRIKCKFFRRESPSDKIKTLSHFFREVHYMKLVDAIQLDATLLRSERETGRRRISDPGSNGLCS